MLYTELFDFFTVGVGVKRAAEIDLVATKSACAADESEVIWGQGNMPLGYSQNVNSAQTAGFRDAEVGGDDGVFGDDAGGALGVTLRHSDYFASVCFCRIENKL